MIKNIEKIYDRLSNVSKIYKITYNDERISFVPLDPANTDYQAIQKWIAKGGVVIDNPPTQENI
jgi:hypothetical protein